MVEILALVIPDLLGGVLAIICAIIGAKIATVSTWKRDRYQELCDIYTDLFSAYYRCSSDLSDENLFLLAVAAERVQLICPDEITEKTKQLTLRLARGEKDFIALGPLVQELRELAKNDMKYYQRKKNRSKVK